MRYREEHVAGGFAPYLVGVRLFLFRAVKSLWVFCMVVFGINIFLGDLPPGTTLVWYVVAYDTGRFYFEFLRGDAERPYIWGFSQPQWISVILMCLVVWLEITKVLPFQKLHLVITAYLILTMITITLKRRAEKTYRFELLHPKHIKEVAEALRLVTKVGDDKGKALDSSTALPNSYAPTTLHLVACTSLGIQISTGKIIDAASGDSSLQLFPKQRWH